jgi:hypothetical protein
MYHFPNERERIIFTLVFLRLLWCHLDVRARSIVPSGQVEVPSLPCVISPPPFHGQDGCFYGQQDQEVSCPSWLKLILFSGLDQHIITRLVWVNGKVKWRSLC